MLWLAALLLVAGLGGVAFVRLAPLPAPEDPATALAPSTPNWALAALKGATAGATPTRDGPVYAATASDLLAALDRVAAAEPRVETRAPPAGERTRAYVQRSALFGYPDLISARAQDFRASDLKASDLDAGADGPRTALILYSRSVYGYGDAGVNAARLDRWIEALDAQLPRFR